MKIGNLETENSVFLAPMAGITDLPFRVIAKSFGAGLSYTEMVSAKGMFYDNAATNSLLNRGSEPGPVGAQIFGSEPEVVAEAVKKLNDMDFGLIDINMGCPAPKIVKNGEGSALMKDIPLMARIIYAAVRAAEKPVTVKIRKGFSSSSANAVEAALAAEVSGAAAITVHGRTRDQYYSGSADWDIIAEVKSAVKIPVIANGDVTGPVSAAECLEKTGADAVMIGRAAYGAPWIFAECAAYLAGRPVPENPDISEKMKTAGRHLALLIEEKGEYTAVREFRRHLSSYLKSFSGAAKLREKSAVCETRSDMEKLIEFIKNLGNVKIE